MVEIDTVIYMDIGVMHFIRVYMYISVFIDMYYLLSCALMRLFIATYIYIFIWFLQGAH